MVTVRAAEPHDLDTLVAFSRGVAVESEGLEPPTDTNRAAIAAALDDPAKARYFVAEADGHAVGSLFVTYEWSDWRNGWYWWIQGAYVVPEKRGQGVFRALYDAVHGAAAQQGDVAAVRLYVHTGNKSAIQVYERLGMREAPYRIFEAPGDT